MSLTLDHIVILVRDLEQTIVDYTSLGFTVQRGGIHADGATHNALVGFADGSYLELIAFLKPATRHRWAQASASGTQGFIDFALLPSNVGSVIDTARSRGLFYTGPVDGGRVRPDGERLAWQIGAPPSPDLPFLCGDITPRALRVLEGSVRSHPNGVQSIASITLVVADLEASFARYRALLGPEASPVSYPTGLPGLGVRIALVALGASTLVLVSRSPQGEEAGADLGGVLARRGNGLLAISLRSTMARVARSLPLALSHGAVIDLEPA
jgi:catechol 2,3-dioxygenase-like lactoylglutathione lyase family enzyme